MEIINQSGIDHLYELFVLGSALIFFWFLESVWRINKRWLVPVLLFPCSIFLFSFIYWEESRSKLFFTALLLFVMLIVGGLVGKSFFVQILSIFKIAAFWPFYLYSMLLPSLRG